MSQTASAGLPDGGARRSKSAEIWPSLGKSWPEVGRSCPHPGRVDDKSADVGRSSPNFDPETALFRRSRPEFVCFWRATRPAFQEIARPAFRNAQRAWRISVGGGALASVGMLGGAWRGIPGDKRSLGSSERGSGGDLSRAWRGVRSFGEAPDPEFSEFLDFEVCWAWPQAQNSENSKEIGPGPRPRNTELPGIVRFPYLQCLRFLHLLQV